MAERLIYLNGELVPASQATVSVFDHGFLYGDGVFEGIRAYSGRIFRLQEHVDRLYRSAHGIFMELPLSRQEMVDAIVRTVAANGIRDGYIRVVASRGRGDLGLSPSKCSAVTLVIIAAGITLYPEAAYEQGLTLASVSRRRPGPDVLDPGVKSLNYLNSILAKVDGELRGVGEVIMLNAQGRVAECSGDNIFIVKGGGVLTPPPWEGLLAGITRQTVMELALERNIPLKEQPLTLQDLYEADECFLTGTAAEVISAVKVDGRVIGTGQPGPITRALNAAYRELAATSGHPIEAEAGSAKR